AAIERALDAGTPAEWRNRGLMLLRAAATRPAYPAFWGAIEGNPNDDRALEGLIEASAQLRRSADTGGLLTRLASDPTHLPAKLTLSRFFPSQGQCDKAVRVWLG